MKEKIFASIFCLIWGSAIAMEEPEDNSTKRGDAANISQILKDKVNPSHAEMSLDENHPAIRVANRVVDDKERQTVLEFCHAFSKQLNVLVSFFHSKTSQERWRIFEAWNRASLPDSSILDRPILEAGQLLQSLPSTKEPVHVIEIGEPLEKYLRGWDRSPCVLEIGSEYHTAVLSIYQKEQKVGAHFCDGYEWFGPGSYLERKTKKALRNVFGINFNESGFTTSYTKHQKLEAFGECRLYAVVHRKYLEVGTDPSIILHKEMVNFINYYKQLLRKGFPNYFEPYDLIYEFVFRSGFACNLLKEIELLPPEWE
jgi:hypothetical protein